MTRVLNFADGFSTDTVPGITSTITTVSGPIYQDNVSGSNVVLTSIVYSVIRLINSGLVSIDTIPAGTEGQMITVINATGVDVTISNNTGATVANRILTGQKASIVLKDEASIILEYDTNELRWMVVGGTGSGSGSSSNYVTNSDSEAGTTGYATYNNAAGVNPVDATGGSPSVTLAASSSSPLFGTKSFLLSKGATNRQGDGVAYAYTLSAGDATQVLSLTMPYSTTANYVDGDVRVGIYDVTNAQIIEGTQRGLAANTNGFYVSSFQMPSNSTSFRIFWHISSTNASAYDIKFDNVVLEKKPVVKGAIVTDWISYTPTFSAGFGTVTNAAGKYKREGDSLRLIISCTTGTTAASIATITLPPGLSIDSSKLTINNTTSNGGNLVGSYNTTQPTAGMMGNVVTATETSTTLLYLGDRDASAASHLTPANGSAAVSSGSVFSLTATVPIVGWSSSVALSEDAGNRVVAFKAYLNSAANHTSASGFQKVPIDTVAYDTSGGWDAVNTRWAATESGYYWLSACARFNSLADAKSGEANIYVNGSVVARGTFIAQGAAQSQISFAQCIQYLNKGDYVENYAFQDDSASEAYVNTNQSNNISGFKIQTPQSIGQSEVVNCKYTCATGLNLSSSGTTYFLDFATKSYDTHDAVLGEGSGIVSTTNTGWRFVCPQAGVYSVSSAIRFVSSAAWASGEGARLDVYKNGSVESEIDYKDSLITTGSPSMVLTGTTDVKCNKGDYLEIGATQSSGGALALNGIGTLNYVAIKKVG